MADLVEHWKTVARTQMASERGGTAASASVTVRVSFGFALLCAVIGLRSGLVGSLAALVGLTSMVLGQELPRAALARTFGRSSKVMVTVLGAHTEISGPPLRGAAKLSVATIGSFCNFLVAFVAFAVTRLGSFGNAAPLLQTLALSHAAWGLVQILPLVPFRVGILVSSRLGPMQRFAHAAGSLIIALGLCAMVDSAQLAGLVPLLALVAFAAASTLGRSASERLDELNGATKLAREAADRFWEGNSDAAAELAQQALAVARAPRLRESLWTTLAWAGIAKRDPVLAHQAIHQLSDSSMDFHLIAAYLSCCNRIDEAEQLLLEARSLGHRDREATKLLIDLFFRRGRSNAALELARSDDGLLAPDDWDAIEAALLNARDS